MKDNEPDKINMNVMKLFAEDNRREQEERKMEDKAEEISEIDFSDTAQDQPDETENAQDSQGKSKLSPAVKNLLDWVKIIVIAVAIAFITTTFIIINSIVPSGSMESTIQTGTRMIGFRLSYLFSEPKQGDIIIFKYPDDEKQIFVKRIIGCPGDVVEIIGGVTYVNGEELDEPYLNEPAFDMDFGPYYVPEDSYFVMGDNRNHSRDARYWENTFVTRKQILAKAVFKYWPVGEIGVLK